MDEPTPDQMGVTEDDVGLRKALLQFDHQDEERLKELRPEAQAYADAVIDEFYNHILSHDETRRFFKDPRVLERVKRLQRAYFLQLTDGEYGLEYVRSRLKIGLVHQRINLPLKSYFAMYNFYLRAVARRLLSDPKGATRVAIDRYMSLLKVIFFDIGLALESHVYLRESTIHQQAEVIRELSTPVLQVRDRLLIAPLIGVIDTKRALQLTEQLLHAVRAHRAKVVVVDITGVAVVDSAVANHLIQTVQATRLMGAQLIITGVSSEIAQTLVRIGVDLAQLNTVGDLQEGISAAERLLGYKVVKIDPPEEPEAEETEGA